ncbi:hypothetical protein RhiJN_22616 [Ceratobasidium sp. AG-Ba]|nr:hypothetical protein RhiJN_22616 [Ceratobasidium sp. AG-Ba]
MPRNWRSSARVSVQEQATYNPYQSPILHNKMDPSGFDYNAFVLQTWYFPTTWCNEPNLSLTMTYHTRHLLYHQTKPYDEAIAAYDIAPTWKRTVMSVPPADDTMMAGEGSLVPDARYSVAKYEGDFSGVCQLLVWSVEYVYWIASRNV